MTIFVFKTIKSKLKVSKKKSKKHEIPFQMFKSQSKKFKIQSKKGELQFEK